MNSTLTRSQYHEAGTTSCPICISLLLSFFDSVTKWLLSSAVYLNVLKGKSAYHDLCIYALCAFDSGRLRTAAQALLTHRIPTSYSARQFENISTLHFPSTLFDNDPETRFAMHRRLVVPSYHHGLFSEVRPNLFSPWPEWHIFLVPTPLLPSNSFRSHHFKSLLRQH